MKLPRWLLWSMLSISVVALLVTGAWWWVTWPKRTAWNYVSLLPTDASNPMLSPAVAEISRKFEALLGTDAPIPIYRSVPPAVHPEQRSLVDVLIGRQSFSWEVEYDEQLVNEFVVVERGWIVDMGVILDKRYSVLDSTSY